DLGLVQDELGPLAGVAAPALLGHQLPEARLTQGTKAALQQLAERAAPTPLTGHQVANVLAGGTQEWTPAERIASPMPVDAPTVMRTMNSLARKYGHGDSPREGLSPNARTSIRPCGNAAATAVQTQGQAPRQVSGASTSNRTAT